MDDPAKNPQHPHPAQQPVPPSDNAGDTPMVQPVSDATSEQHPTQHHPQAQSQQPIAPVGGMHKEFGPMGGAVVEAPVAEVLQPTEQAPVLEAEVAEAGVEVAKNPEEVPDLTLHDKNAGISHAPVATPVLTTPSDSIKLPIPEEKAEKIVKKEKQSRNAITWIALMVLRQLKVMHAKLKGGENGH